MTGNILLLTGTIKPLKGFRVGRNSTAEVHAGCVAQVLHVSYLYITNHLLIREYD